MSEYQFCPPNMVYMINIKVKRKGRKEKKLKTLAVIIRSKTDAREEFSLSLSLSFENLFRSKRKKQSRTKSAHHPQSPLTSSRLLHLSFFCFFKSFVIAPRFALPSVVFPLLQSVSPNLFLSVKISYLRSRSLFLLDFTLLFQIA